MVYYLFCCLLCFTANSKSVLSHYFYFDVYAGSSIAMEELGDAKLFLQCIF